MTDLSVDIAGVRLANPMMTASGTCGYANEYADFVDLTGLGAFVTKSITAQPRLGTPPHRVVEPRKVWAAIEGRLLDAPGCAGRLRDEWEWGSSSKTTGRHLRCCEPLFWARPRRGRPCGATFRR